MDKAIFCNTQQRINIIVKTDQWYAHTTTTYRIRIIIIRDKLDSLIKVIKSKIADQFQWDWKELRYCN